MMSTWCITGIKGEAEVTHWSVTPEYGSFLIKIFDEWVRKDVGSYYVQLFDVTLANWMGESNPGVMRILGNLW
jgi:uncharacterized protein